MDILLLPKDIIINKEELLEDVKSETINKSYDPAQYSLNTEELLRTEFSLTNDEKFWFNRYLKDACYNVSVKISVLNKSNYPTYEIDSEKALFLVTVVDGYDVLPLKDLIQSYITYYIVYKWYVMKNLMQVAKVYEGMYQDPINSIRSISIRGVEGKYTSVVGGGAIQYRVYDIGFRGLSQRSVTVAGQTSESENETPNYITPDNLQQGENIILKKSGKNITISAKAGHTHSNLTILEQITQKLVDKLKSMVPFPGFGKTYATAARGNHNHDTKYSDINHDHEGVYAQVEHEHNQYLEPDNIIPGTGIVITRYEESKNVKIESLPGIALDEETVARETADNTLQSNIDYLEQNVSETRVAKAGDVMSGPLELSGDPTTEKMASTKKYVDDKIAELYKQSLTYKGYISSAQPTADLREGNYWSNQALEPNVPPSIVFPWPVDTFTSGAWAGTSTDYTPIAMDLWYDVDNAEAWYYIGDQWERIDFSGSTFDPDMFTVINGVVTIKDASISNSKIAANADIDQSKIKGLATTLSQKAEKTELHTHSNKSVLDKLTDTLINTWNALVSFPGFAANGQSAAGKAVGATDSRLSNARPASDVSAWAKAASKPTYTAAEVGAAAANHNHSDLQTAILTEFNDRRAADSTLQNQINVLQDVANTVPTPEVPHGTFDANFEYSTFYTPIGQGKWYKIGNRVYCSILFGIKSSFDNGSVVRVCDWPEFVINLPFVPASDQEIAPFPNAFPLFHYDNTFIDVNVQLIQGVRNLVNLKFYAYTTGKTGLQNKEDIHARIKAIYGDAFYNQVSIMGNPVLNLCPEFTIFVSYDGPFEWNFNYIAADQAAT